MNRPTARRSAIPQTERGPLDSPSPGTSRLSGETRQVRRDFARRRAAQPGMALARKGSAELVLPAFLPGEIGSGQVFERGAGDQVVPFRCP